MAFANEIGHPVQLCFTEEMGEVIGRAEYANGENTYLVRYRAADGRMVEIWWGESALDNLATERPE